MARQEGGQCSIAAMKHPLAWALGGFAVFGFLRRRREVAQVPDAVSPDPRAEELRRKLAESRAIVDERDEFESAELTVDLAEPAPVDPDTRRRAVHDSARETVERMRRPR
jgi:MYXO-CTERM domain-containing protein